jgi:uncharacterized membrane protein YqiK
LEERGACADGIKAFAEVWPDGMPLTQENLVSSAAAGLTVEWLPEHLLSTTAYAEYVHVRATASADCRRVRASAYAEHRITIGTARTEYDRVRALAEAEYRRVRASARAEYDRVRAPARAEYRRVIAAAIWDAWQVDDAGEGMVRNGSD